MTIVYRHKIKNRKKNDIRFFMAKYETLQLYPNGHPFSTAKYKILKTVPKGPFFIQPFALCLQDTKFKVVLKRPFVFLTTVEPL